MLAGDSDLADDSEVLKLAKYGFHYLDHEQMKTRRREEVARFVAIERAKKASSQTLPQVKYSGSSGIYQPLSADAKEIRVLELFPGSFGDELSGKLHICSVKFEYEIEPIHAGTAMENISVGETPFNNHAVSLVTGERFWYTALSYVWGLPVFSHTLICDGSKMKITESLSCALKHLRHVEHSVMIWCDQICINQVDLDEKSHQIILMATVYERAWGTIIWLGEDKGFIDNAFSAIRDINLALQYYIDETAPLEHDLERLRLPLAHSKVWKDIGLLFELPWFQRLWVIQEVVLTMDVHVMSGFNHISWPQIGLFTIIATKHDLLRFIDSETSSAGCQRARNLDSMKEMNVNHPSGRTLLSALVDGRGSNATNPRDKVYGIMGLSARKLHPDYSETKSYLDIYHDAAVLAYPTEIISLLYCVDHVEPSRKSPSWVPDWSLHRVTERLGYGTEERGVYKATAERKHAVTLVDGGKALSTPASFVDTVLSISAEFKNPKITELISSVEDSETNTKSIINTIVKAIIETPGIGYHNVFEAFVRTCFAGVNSDGLQSTPPGWFPVFSLILDTATGRCPSLPDQTYPKRPLTLDNLKVRGPARIYSEMRGAFLRALKGRRFCMTEQRRMGLVPLGSQPGDKIVILPGGHVPFVFRPTLQSKKMNIIGECFVEGLMNDEVATLGYAQEHIMIV